MSYDMLPLAILPISLFSLSELKEQHLAIGDQ